MIQYTIEDIKRMLLRCISEYSCEAELLIKFAENENEYMIIIYDDHCSFQRCGVKGKGSGEYNYKTLEQLFLSQQVDNIMLERDWNNIEYIDCMDFDVFNIW